MSDAATHDRDSDLERFITFVDAIVAIAITLLVLPLVEVVNDLGDGESVADLLSDHWPELWAFVLSFVVIARLWYSQHHAVRLLARLNGQVFTILSAWALTIVFLPFPTSLVAEATNDWLTKTLYMGTMALNLFILAGLELLMIRRPALRTGAEQPDIRGALVNGGLFGVALAVSLAIPATSYFPLLLLALDTPIQRALFSGGRS